LGKGVFLAPLPLTAQSKELNVLHRNRELTTETDKGLNKTDNTQQTAKVVTKTGIPPAAQAKSSGKKKKQGEV
jgi:hypothetical protein